MRRRRVITNLVTYTVLNDSFCTIRIISICNPTGGTDYYIGTYNTTFYAGKTSASINILIADDNILEPNESFGLYIDSSSLPSGVIRISPYSATVTILNDDCKLIILLYMYLVHFLVSVIVVLWLY